MSRKNTKKRMQQQPQPSAPQAHQPSTQQLPQQQQPVPTWAPPKQQQEQQQQQQQASEPDLFGEEFFSQPPAAHAAPAIDLRWDDLDVPRIAPDKRRAMLATIVIFSVFAVAVGGFVIYTQMIMPTPVALGASSVMLTVPEAALYVPEPTPIAAPAPAPVVVAVAHAEPAPIETAHTPIIASPVIHAAVVHAPVVRTRRTAPAAVPDDSLAAQAMRMLNGGRAADARRLAQQATHANPERAEGWIVLGAASASLGDQESAKTAYANCTARATGPRVATCRALAR